jgi:hypothetical protein
MRTSTMIPNPIGRTDWVQPHLVDPNPFPLLVSPRTLWGRDPSLRSGTRHSPTRLETKRRYLRDCAGMALLALSGTLAGVSPDRVQPVGEGGDLQVGILQRGTMISDHPITSPCPVNSPVRLLLEQPVRHGQAEARQHRPSPRHTGSIIQVSTREQSRPVSRGASLISRRETWRLM